MLPDAEEIVLLKEKHLESPVKGEGIKKQLDILFFEWGAVNGACKWKRSAMLFLAKVSASIQERQEVKEAEGLKKQITFSP